MCKKLQCVYSKYKPRTEQVNLAHNITKLYRKYVNTVISFYIKLLK